MNNSKEHQKQQQLHQQQMIDFAIKRRLHAVSTIDTSPSRVINEQSSYHSAESIDVAFGHIGQSGTKSVVSYTPMTELDYGTLLCWAKNHIGSQLVPCVYHITPAGHPDMVHNCTTRIDTT